MSGQRTTADVIALGVQAHVPVLVWGAPGTGKTAWTNALALALGLPCETVIASIREPSDFCGLPVIHDGDVRMAPPAWARRLAAAGKGLLFFDEISTAAPAVQAGLLRVVLDRVVGELALPEGISILAAANPPEQAAGGWELSAPLANRFVHVEWPIDVQGWTLGMLQGWPPVRPVRLPKGWDEGIGEARARIASFVHVRPGQLLAVPKDAAAAGRAWPSPRSWDAAARMLAACAAVGADEEIQLAAVGGAVGPAVALEFLSWLRDLDLPDPEMLLKEPGKFKLPKRGDQQFAVLAAVAAAAVRELTKERYEAAWQIMATAAKTGAVDVAAAAVRGLAQAGQRRPDLPPPIKHIEPFVPILKAAGLL